MSKHDFETALLDAIDALPEGKTLNPSDVAKQLDPEEWRSLLTNLKRTAKGLARQNRIGIYRKGKLIEPDAMKGIIRFGHPGPAEAATEPVETD